MQLIKFVMFLFYRYYSKGGTFRIPYFSALCAVVFLIYIHIFQLLIIFNAVDLLPMRSQNTRISNYAKLATFLSPLFFIIHFLIKEDDLKKLTYDDSKIKKGGIMLIGYIILSFALLMSLMFLFPTRRSL